MDVPMAGPNKRVCAFLIDSFLFEMIGLSCIVVVAFDISWIIWIAGILLKDCYNGQSLGKRVVGTQVLDDQGAPAEPFKTIQRNITMALPIFPIIEYIVMLRDKVQGRRLGDQWAKTRVADLKPEAKDSVYLWVSLGLVVLMIIIKLAFSLYLMKSHPELMGRGTGSPA